MIALKTPQSRQHSSKLLLGKKSTFPASGVEVGGAKWLSDLFSGLTDDVVGNLENN